MPAFLLPDLGEGLTEAEIVAWRVEVGDTVVVDQTVVEVETAKAVVEVPVPFAGQVAALHGKPGDVLAVGQPLITVAGAEAEAGQPIPAGATPFAEPGIVSAPKQPDESGQVLIGYGTSAARRRRRRRAATLPVSADPGQTASAESASPARPAPANGLVAVVSPLVRRLAREAGVDVAAIRGSGDGGLVTRRDVDAAIASLTASAPVRPAPAPAPAPGTGSTATPGELTRIPLRGARKLAADKLTRSRREIPEATVWVDVDATGLLELRSALNAREAAPGISLLAIVSRMAILGLARYPELNARVEGDEIVLGPSVHLGFAAQTDRGLVVPVVPDAQAATLEQLSDALADRTRRAREGGLAPADLTGGTFTINNYGVFGVDGSAAIINYPEVAILGIGRIIQRAWIVDGLVAARHVTELTLAFDHRVCDGGTAGGFLRFVADCIESPMSAMRYL